MSYPFSSYHTFLSIKFLIVVIAAPLLSFAQLPISGKIIDKKSGLGIPYATVGLMKENTGINADKNGLFVLQPIKNLPGDSLVVSSVGYETIKVPVNEILSKPVLELSPKAIILKEVVITNSTTTNTLNKFSKFGWGYTTVGYQTQLAQPMESPVENAKLLNVRIGMMQKEKAIFRLRIYAADTVTKAPAEDLATEVIEIVAGGKHVTVDLENYDIYVPKHFFVAVEWLKITSNEDKHKWTQDGKEYEDITFRPNMGMTEEKDEKNQAWALTYQGKWSLLYWGKQHLVAAISATIIY